ncbi:MAG: calcium-binding protein, partial [Microvirga sp.]
NFNVKDDAIYLENAIFKKLGSKGSELKPAQLSKAAFWIGNKAHDANDRIIYNKQKGILLYDEDGTGAKAAIQIAILDRNIKKISEKDFFIV